MELYVVRHAIAFDQDPGRWPDDAERPLTEEGKQKFARAARGLRKIASDVDVVLASPFVRAVQTALILEAEAGWPAPKECDALTPERTPGATVTALRPYAEVGSVALVGHEPHLSTLISFLLDADDDAFALKKGGAACLDVTELVAGGASLRWLVTPKIERALSD